MRPLIASCVLFSAICFAGPAFAQDKPASGADAPVAPTATPTDPAAPAAGQPPADPNASKKPFDEGFSPIDDAEKQRRKKEDENKTQFFLGLRFRDFIIPAFMFHIFAKGGPGAVNMFSFGPELTVNTGNLEVNVSFTIPYADASMKPFLFKAKNDPDQAYEIVSSDLKLFTASADILGNIPFDKERRVAMLIGADFGVMGVAGNIYRNQAYPKDPSKINPDDPSQWLKCASANNPPTKTPQGGTYCDASNNHYGNYTEPSWAHGGSKPFIFPYIAPLHLAFRVQPVKLLQLRVDGGFSITGFFVGAAAGLKLPI